MDFHKTFENYYQAKKKLFHMATKGAVINVDDKYGRRLYEEIKEEGNYPVIGYGFSEDADVCCIDKKKNGRRTSVKIRYDGRTFFYDLPVEADYNLYNMLAVFGYGFLSGKEDRLKRLENFKGAAGRFERIENDKGLHLIVDFAHSPDALDNLLSSIDKEEKIRLVFGVAGDRTDEIKREMGRVAARYCDKIYITTDDPKKSDPRTIAKRVIEGIDGRADYVYIENREEAIRRAVKEGEPGDYIFFTGKSEEKVMKYDGYTKEYNEKESIRKALE